MSNGGHLDGVLKALKARGKSAPVGTSYGLDQPSSYGLDTFIDPQALRVDEARMSVHIPFADGRSRDGVGDLLEVGGIDCSRHIQNPIALYDHGKAVTLPIGLAEDPLTRLYTVELDQTGRRGCAETFFYQGKGMGAGVERGREYEHAVFCHQLFDLMCKRLVRGGSIGYTVIAARDLPPDPATGTPKGLHLLAVKMLELSAVVLPANQDTVTKSMPAYLAGMADTAREILSMPDVCGKSLSPALRKSLEPFAKEARTTVSFAGVAAKETPAPCEYRLGDEVSVESEEYDCLLYELEVGGTAVLKTRDGRKIRVKTTDLKPPERRTCSGKSLQALKKKYRPVKVLRRRIKRSSAGSSVLHVAEKDLDLLEEKAAGCGVRLDWLGRLPHGAKVKLTGDDGRIDDLAKEFGVPMPVAGVRTKAMPEGGGMTGEEILDDGLQGGDSPQEPYGAQVLRRLHGDHSILLEDYDGMLAPLEHEKVRDLLGRHLEDKTGFLDEVEKAFASHYPDLPPLGGMKDMGGGDEVLDDEFAEEDGIEGEEMPDEDVDEFSEEEELPEEDEGEDLDDFEGGSAPGSPASAGDYESEEDEPTPEEAWEGSQKRLKHLRMKYRRKGVDEEDDGKAFHGVGNTTVVSRRVGGGRSRRNAAIVDTVRDADREAARVGGANEHGYGDGPEPPKPRAGKPSNSSDNQGWEPETEGPDPREAQAQPPSVRNSGAKGMWADHERDGIGEAAEFLGGLAEPESVFDEEERMKSYHYHKTFDGIVRVKGWMKGMDEFPEDRDHSDELGFDGLFGEPAGKAHGAESEDVARQRKLSGVSGPGANAERQAQDRARRQSAYESGQSQRDAEARDLADRPGGAEARQSAENYRRADRGPRGAPEQGPDSDRYAKSMTEASEFFRALAREKAFGNIHRDQCSSHCAALKGLITDEPAEVAEELEEEFDDANGEYPDRDPDEAPEGEEEEDHVGEAGEKARRSSGARKQTERWAAAAQRSAAKRPTGAGSEGIAGPSAADVGRAASGSTDAGARTPGQVPLARKVDRKPGARHVARGAETARPQGTSQVDTPGRASGGMRVTTGNRQGGGARVTVGRQSDHGMKIGGVIDTSQVKRQKALEAELAKRQKQLDSVAKVIEQLMEVTGAAGE